MLKSETVANFVKSEMTAQYGEDGLVKDTAKLVGWIGDLWKENDRTVLKEIYDQAAKDCQAYLKTLRIIKEGKTKRGQKAKVDDSPEQVKSTEVKDEGLPDIG